MSEQKYKSYRYYEGLCSTKDIVKEIAKVLSIGVRSNQVKDVEGNVLLNSFILQSKNWDIVYPKPDSTITIDESNMTADEYKAKILNQISQISDSVILKTTTTPVEVDVSEIDDLAENNDASKTSLTMYLQLYKPTYIANPEEYPLDCELQGVIPKVITKNMHKDALSVSKQMEEVVTSLDNPVCKMSETSTTKKDVVVFTVQSECSMVVSKIISIYGENAAKEGFYMTTIPGMATNNLTFDKTKVLEIKAKDNDLYGLIRETLNVDDNEFQSFTTLTFNLKAENTDMFILSIEAITKKQIYTVSGTYSIQNVSAADIITTTLVPEYYIDGVYIPLNSDLWDYDPSVLNNRGIRFKKPITGDIAKDGNIILRYKIKKEADENVSERAFMLNNHYMLARVFDEINEEGNGPSQTTYNDKGEVVIQRAHVSDWSKLSWYQDFEEIYQDEIDADTTTNTIADGTLLVPLETAGLNGETKIRYWLNTNNDRFNLIVMGNPSLDYEKERHIISACYCGKIDSFDFSVNDTAGNFALFTSSSTESCKSVLTKEKTFYEIDYTGNDYSSPEFKSFLDSAYVVKCSSDTVEYYVQLSDGRFFNKSLWPKYIVMDSNGIPITDLRTVYQINYVEENQAVISIHQAYDSDYTLYIGYPYYEEKVVLTSGVERDIFGNVLDVIKTDTFGANTSDGTTSVMMYHTQSKAYYQKHHMMFTTTEEYMSKAMYGKSMYTNEYYADRIKITHGNDGPRGMLNDMLVIDSSSLYPFDELVINKDFEKNPEEYEETYIYFPVTAPYSPLSDSPNARYGLAIKKSEAEPDFADEKKIVDIAIDELRLLANESWWGITSNIYPLSKTSNNSTVLWEISEDSKWIDTEQNPSTYSPIELALVATAELKGDSSTPLIANQIASEKVTQSDDVNYIGSKIESKVLFDTTDLVKDAEATSVYYGVVHDTPKINKNAVIKVQVTPPNNTGEFTANNYFYGVEGVPFCDTINEEGVVELILKNAKPTDKLIVYGVLEEESCLIKNFALCDLTQDLIKYPCEIKTSIVKGSGALLTSPIKTINYGLDYTAIIKPDTGWNVEKVIVTDSDGVVQTLLVAELTLDDATGQYSILLTEVKRDMDISIVFKANSL